MGFFFSTCHLFNDKYFNYNKSIIKRLMGFLSMVYFSES